MAHIGRGGRGITHVVPIGDIRHRFLVDAEPPMLLRDGTLLSCSCQPSVCIHPTAQVVLHRMLALRGATPPSPLAPAPSPNPRSSPSCPATLQRAFVTQAALLGKTALQIAKTTRHVNLTELAGYVDEIQHTYGDAGISTDDVVHAAIAA